MDYIAFYDVIVKIARALIVHMYAKAVDVKYVIFIKQVARTGRIDCMSAWHGANRFHVINLRIDDRAIVGIGHEHRIALGITYYGVLQCHMVLRRRI
jgi:hypothetical protein